MTPLAPVRPPIIQIDEALGLLQNGAQRMVTAMAAAEPQILYQNLHKVLPHLQHKLRIYTANPSQLYPCFTEGAYDEQIEFVVMFLTECIRKAHGPRIQYFPHHLSQWFSAIMQAGEKPDIYWGSCSVPDARGFVSLGPSACYETEAFYKAKVRVLEINPALPATFGSTIVPLSDVNYFLESSRPIPTVRRPAIEEEDRAIAAYVADLVKDGSTLQLGIGSIPNAIGLALEHKKDLGVHTEMMNDTMMDLYEKGVITGAKKTRWPRKMIAAFAYGTEELYRFIDRNPVVELHPASVVNDPYRIGQNYRMVSINSAVEVDLTGQVCSESVGHRELSGIGGAMDTHTGAQRSVEGQGLIVIRSTAAQGKASKIVFELKPGAKVSVGRNDVDTIVTEFGVARLKGKTVAERVNAMIQIAHPQFRDELRHSAKQASYI